ncbi:MAG TPA: STAS domain-containing protein [Candidatus Competibacteraceae bacterium]|nr:STAS domain-containing protein [Candidatus Competibacteraceae bacterium]
MTAGQAFYAKQGDTLIIKLVGDIRYTMSCSVDDFLEQWFANKNGGTMQIDLSEVECIDSTSLGLLAKAANFMHTRFGNKVTLISPNPDITQLLDSVGFTTIFEIRPNGALPAESMQRLHLLEPTKAELAKTMFEAHQVLSDMNEKNRDAFKDVVEALRNKLIKRNAF